MNRTTLITFLFLVVLLCLYSECPTWKPTKAHHSWLGLGLVFPRRSGRGFTLAGICTVSETKYFAYVLVIYTLRVHAKCLINKTLLFTFHFINGKIIV